ncbi:hypothetical protein M0R45_017541 [Rubus argutus]|uniref:DUF7870 domain-containing protein n=1 Tax=Rubus argutus TaxID=59490 RepID=A0AAW1XWL0_RUBAR
MFYIDVGARSYGSSIGSWFKKQYPKQNKSFEVYAIEADRAFHEEYRSKKGWQRCCPGQRSPKFKKTYGQCLDLFTKLRDAGVLVHQWW